VAAVEVARFFASPWGRWLRVLVGAVLLVLGYLGAPWWVPAIGVVLILAAALNVCGLAVLFGGPFDGRRVQPRA
jgi:hypothetical protein